MPINIRKTTNWRSIRETPAALFELWLKLRVRWRHNPGFVAAAAAGSIGLLLALVMAIQGGIRLLDEVPPGDEMAEVDTYAVLGDAAALGAEDEPSDPFAESGTRVRPAARSLIRADEELEIRDEEEAVESEPGQRPSRDRFVVKPAARKHLMDDDFDEVVAGEIDAEKHRHPLTSEGEAADDSRGPHPLDEHPLASEPSPSRRFPRKFVAIDDEGDDSERDDIELKADEALDERAAQTTTGKAERLKLDLGDVFGTDKQDADMQDDAEDAVLETAADSIQPAARVAESAPAGWKTQPHRPLAATESSPALTERSRSVETVITATPARKAAAPGRSPLRQDTGKARLSLELAGPRAAFVGQTCKFEIRVTNKSSQSADKLTLSVELPDELVHQVGQSLEQHIEKLAPGQTYWAVVRAQAKASGKMVLDADLAEDGAVVGRSSASVVIGAATRMPAKADLPDCECLPLSQAR